MNHYSNSCFVIHFRQKRLIKENGKCVLLVNSNEINVFEEQLKLINSFKLISKHSVSLGKTNAHLYKLIKI